MRLTSALIAAAALAGGAASGSSAQALACGAEVTSDVTLEASLVGCSTGLVIAADGITVDLNGHAIVGLGAAGSAGVDAVGRSDVTVRNGFVGGFETGVRLADSADSTVEGMTVTDASVGIDAVFSFNSRVAGNTVFGNSDSGIHCLDRSSSGNRIERNRAVGNGTGIALDRCSGATLTKNVAFANRSHGILLDESFSLVEGNNASGNGGSGIHAFNSHGQFSKNVTNANGGDGLFIDDADPTHGPFHTVTSHVANANGGWGIAALAGTVDGGKNRAHANRGGTQCLSVLCK
jgi:parallel beta-helix repeat protein